MTHAAIDASRLLEAAGKARNLRNPNRPSDVQPTARLNMLEDLARHVSKDAKYLHPRYVNVSIEDFALIAEYL